MGSIDEFFHNTSKTRQQYCRLERFAMKTDIPMNGSMVKNHISFWTGFEYIVVSGVSTSSSSGPYQSISRTLLRQESHHLSFSSSSRHLERPVCAM